MKCLSKLLFILVLPLMMVSCSQRYAHLSKVKVKQNTAGHSTKEIAPEANSPEELSTDMAVGSVVFTQPGPKALEKTETRTRDLTKPLTPGSKKNKIAAKVLRNIQDIPSAIIPIPKDKKSEKKATEAGKTQWAGALFLGLLLILAGAVLGIIGLANAGVLLGSIGFVLIIIALVLLVLGGA